MAHTTYATNDYPTAVNLNGNITWAAYETNPFKLSVKAMTTAALAANTATATTLTANANGAFSTIDGQTISLNDAIWVNNEASTQNNGAYTLTDAGSAGTPWILTRAAWLTTDATFLAGLVFYVRAGTTNGGKFYMVHNATPNGVLTTDSLTARSMFYEILSLLSAAGDMLYASAAGVLARVAVNSTATRKFLRQVSSGAPAWDTLTSVDITDFTEAAQDVVGALVADSATIDATYNDAGNTESLAVLSAPRITGITRTAVADAGYTALSTDYLIAYTSLTASRTVALPAAASSSGLVLIIKDEAGAAATWNIVIDGNAAETIDNAATLTLSTNYGVARIYCNGTAWFTF